MINPDPIHEHQATPEIAAIYADIKNTLDTSSVPIMFKYLANYPHYFELLWLSIRENLIDPTFEILTDKIHTDVALAANHLKSHAPLSEKMMHQLIPELTIRRRVAEEIKHQLELQCKLAFITIAIREATKGWAIGAKYLSSEQAFHSMDETETKESLSDMHNMVLVDVAETTAALSTQADLQKPLMSFVIFLHEEFADIIRKESYVYARVQVEQSIVMYIPNMPHPIRASYNEVVKMIPDQKQLPYLFYLLSEKFPTVNAIACLMWAYGYALSSE